MRTRVSLLKHDALGELIERKYFLLIVMLGE